MTFRTALTACATLFIAALTGAAANTAFAQDILTSRAADRQQTILDGARKEGRVVL